MLSWYSYSQSDLSQFTGNYKLEAEERWYNSRVYLLYTSCISLERLMILPETSEVKWFRSLLQRNLYPSPSSLSQHTNTKTFGFPVGLLVLLLEDKLDSHPACKLKALGFFARRWHCKSFSLANWRKSVSVDLLFHLRAKDLFSSFSHF